MPEEESLHSGGLSLAEVERQRQKYGWNEVTEHHKSRWLLFFSQFQDIMIYILLAAAAVSVGLPFLREGHLKQEDIVNASVIFAIILLNAFLGFFQEWRAENAIALLRKLSAPQVKVRRGGVVSIIPAREIVPGDMLLLEAGDRISADGRVVASASFEVDEASLTGESIPVYKKVDEESLASPNAIGMVYAGTLVTRGYGEVIATATGLMTEIGKITSMVMDLKPPPTPLQLQLRRVGKNIGVLVLSLCVAIFLLGLYRGMPAVEMFFTAVSLAVAAVPEGLPAVVTICLALGVQRMLKKHALIRQLDAVETLGNVTVICADKTGTITENRMRVQEIRAYAGVDPSLVLEIAAACNRAELPDIGDPTEVALLIAAKERGVRRLPILEEEVPFTSEAKYMVTTHRHGNGTVRYLKGAPEVIARLCEKGDTETMLRESEQDSRGGLRVLAVARGHAGTVECVGLLSLLDAPRQGIEQSIEQARVAGVRTIMITGDHPATALAIAKKIGIASDQVIDGVALERMNAHELTRALKHTSVFARVQPAHKVKILESLQAAGEIVAMSGDGVNDAPALKRAHVGVAMGMQGTDVARESASMVLTDDNYATIVAAIEEGRCIYDNIRKFVLFLMRSNMGEVAIIAISMFFGMPLPLLPLHILWINLVTDSLPALALAAERGEGDVMRRRPRKRHEGIFSGEWPLIMASALLNASVALGMFVYVLHAYDGNLLLARTVALTVTILFQLSIAFSAHTKQVVFREALFSNRWLLGAISLSFLLQFILLYTPLGTLFSVVPLSLILWIQMIVVTVVAFLFMEGIKWWNYYKF
jgi:Ca2+-transporting ATPase